MSTVSKKRIVLTTLGVIIIVAGLYFVTQKKDSNPDSPTPSNTLSQVAPSLGQAYHRLENPSSYQYDSIPGTHLFVYPRVTSEDSEEQAQNVSPEPPIQTYYTLSEVYCGLFESQSGALLGTCNAIPLENATAIVGVVSSEANASFAGLIGVIVPVNHPEITRIDLFRNNQAVSQRDIQEFEEMVSQFTF